MRKVALRGLLAHKLRMAMTLGAVALGVAFMAGVLILTETMNRSFDNLFATVYEDVDAVVRSEETIDTGFSPEGGELRGTLDESVLTAVRNEVPTVDEAVGEVEGFAQIIDPDGEAVSGGGFGGPTFATSVDPAVMEDESGGDLSQFGLRQGRWPGADDEIVIDAGTESDIDYQVGDTVPILTKAGVDDYEIVGTVGFGSSDSPAAGQSVVLLTVAEAQRTIGEPGRFNTISVIAAGDTSQEAVAEDIRQVVGEGVDVITGEEAIEEAQSSVRESLSFLTRALLVFAVVAVVVGSFVIYNSFSIVVAQRAREMALLRAVGALRSQVLGAVLVEGVVTGLVGSAVGFVLGIGLAGLFGGFAGVESGVAIPPSAVVVAFSVGLLVTVLSSLLPAWRASRVAPVAAMRDIAVDVAGRSLVRLILGTAICSLGVVLVLSGALAGELLVVGLGLALTLLGVIFLAPTLARPVGSWLGWPLRRFRGITGSLAQQNAARNPRRTASTALALTIGVGIVAFFVILNASMRSSFEKVVDDNFAGDLIIEPGGQGLLGLPEEVAQDVAELPEVQQVTPIRMAQGTIEGDRVFVGGTSPALFDEFGFDVQGSGELAPGQVMVRSGTAESEGLGIGDPVTIDFLDTGPATLEVAGIFEESPGIGFGSYIVGLEELASHVTDTSDSLVIIDLVPAASKDGASLVAARDTIETTISAAAPTANVQDNEDLKDDLASRLNTLLAIFVALLGVSILIAFFGIFNAIALSVMERTRELGLLRAVGMTRPQLRASVRWESAVIALFGAVLGMGVAVLGSWAMIRALHDEGFEVFSLPIPPLVVIAVLASILGVVAAWWPAWRASELNVLDAIHHE